MFAIRDIVVTGVIAGILVAVVLAIRPWSRERGRFAVAGVTTLAGWLAWNLTLNHAGATGFNVDAPVVRISWADTGSGVLAFTVTALVFGVMEGNQPARRVVGAAAVAGAVAIIVDIFVL